MKIVFEQQLCAFLALICGRCFLPELIRCAPAFLWLLHLKGIEFNLSVIKIDTHMSTILATATVVAVIATAIKINFCEICERIVWLIICGG